MINYFLHLIVFFIELINFLKNIIVCNLLYFWKQILIQGFFVLFFIYLLKLRYNEI